MTWTRCEKAYPKDAARVQFVRTDWADKASTDVGHFNVGEMSWSSDAYDDPKLDAVTHWQPLAKPVVMRQCQQCRGEGDYDPDGRGSMPCYACERTGKIDEILWQVTMKK
jgi:hypothetical protein